jgi:hypothetical protein
VTVRTRTLLAAAVGLCLGQALPAAEPAPLGVAPPAATAPAMPANQKVANTIAENLRQNGRLSGYRIDVFFQNGVADVSGAVGDQMQKEEALRIVQGVPGVERVRDHLMLLNPSPVTQVQAAVPPMPPADGAAPMPRPVAPDAGAGPALGIPPGVAPGAGYPGPLEPMPIFQAGPGGGPYSLPPANMPPYAWPTYAPYNNYSRVAAPSAYPPNAWPFIGPPYPFPKVPLGWRKVQLEWIDGHWWFGNSAQCHDWWRLRYW